jgi:hypothetical protein
VRGTLLMAARLPAAFQTRSPATTATRPARGELPACLPVSLSACLFACLPACLPACLEAGQPPPRLRLRLRQAPRPRTNELCLRWILLAARSRPA